MRHTSQFWESRAVDIIIRAVKRAEYSHSHTGFPQSRSWKTLKCKGMLKVKCEISVSIAAPNGVVVCISNPVGPVV